MPDTGKIGVINEIGDLGLGFEELSEKDQKKYSEAVNKKQSDRKDKTNPGSKK